MKNRILGLVAVVLISGCAWYQPKTQFGKNLVAWWNKPETQQVVEGARHLALQYAVNVGLAAVQAYAGGEKVTFQDVALQGGVATLYTQASYIRQLQGTSQVLDPVATAQLLEQGGTSEEISRKLAGQLFENASALIRLGVAPDEAAEIQAAGLDEAARKIAAKEVL